MESVTAESLACLGWEHRLCGLAGALGEPDAHEGDDARREWGDPQLSSLAQATDMRSGAKMKMVADHVRDGFGISFGARRRTGGMGTTEIAVASGNLKR